MNDSYSNGNGGSFFSNSTKNTILSNLILTNSHCNQSGGVIYTINKENITISQNVFINSSSKLIGGTAHITTGSSNIFENWIETSNSFDLGGSFYIYCSTTNTNDIFNCYFGFCSSIKSGGALYIIAFNINIKECTFFYCSSKENGGAIFVSKSILKILISKICCNYCSINESSNFHGTAIFLNGGGNYLQKVEYVSFSKCNAKLSYSPIYMNSGEQFFHSNNFSQNSLMYYCGGRFQPYYTSIYQYINFKNSTSTTGTLSYFYRYSSSMDLEFCNIIENDCKNYGIYFEARSGANCLIIKYCIFINNILSNYLLYSTNANQIYRSCYIVHSGNINYYFVNDNSITSTSLTKTFIITHYSTFLCQTPLELGGLEIIISQNCNILPTPTECIFFTNEGSLSGSLINSIIHLLFISLINIFLK